MRYFCFQNKFLYFIFLFSISCSHRTDVNFNNKCTVIDHDGSFDDLRAIMALNCNSKVTHILFSEGVTRPHSSFKNYQFLKNIYFPKSTTQAYNGVEINKSLNTFWRKVRTRDEALNGFLKNDLKVSQDAIKELDFLAKDLLNRCSSVDVVILGPYTSAVQYLPKIDNILNTVYTFGNSNPKYFNCWYNKNSCTSVFTQFFKKIRGVELPKTDGNRNQYTYSYNFVDQLKSNQNLNILYQIFHADKSGWQNKEVLFWDDAVALFYLKPHLFKSKNNLFEPAIDRKTFESIFLNTLNKCNNSNKVL